MSALALAQPALPALAPDVIDRFAGPYAWLSNGHPSPVEGNTWHDNFWGRCTAHTRREDCPRFSAASFEGHGDNWLGRLQMQIRAELAVLFAP